jgi:hypothetical protein
MSGSSIPKKTIEMGEAGSIEVGVVQTRVTLLETVRMQPARRSRRRLGVTHRQI